jgi:hypothetical protein
MADPGTWRKMGRGCQSLPECLPISQPSKSQITWDLRAFLALLAPSPSCLDTSTPGRWIEWSPSPRLWCNIYQFDVLLGVLVLGAPPFPLGKEFANPTVPHPHPHRPLSSSRGPMLHGQHGSLPRVAIGCRHSTSSSSRAAIGPGPCIPHPPLLACSGLAQRRSGSAAWLGRDAALSLWNNPLCLCCRDPRRPRHPRSGL